MAMITFWKYFDTGLKRKRLIGSLIFGSLVLVFILLNRAPKIDAVGEDLGVLETPGIQCFQGFCIEREPGSSFLDRWWTFSVTYLRLISVGMLFAFAVSGIVDAFFFPSGVTASIFPKNKFKILSGIAIGSSLNLCSACVAPVSNSFMRRGLGIEGSIALTHSSSTLNLPAILMSFFIFTPLIGFSRIFMALISAIIMGPIIARVLRHSRHTPFPDSDVQHAHQYVDVISWKSVLRESFVDWMKFSFIYFLRLAPIMIVAGFFSGLIIQWITPSSVSDHLGNNITGVVIAATLGVLINVPLLFEIPLVALLITLGAGTAPAATLLFAAAAGGPITFWIMSKTIAKKGVMVFASGIWIMALLGGIGVLGVGHFLWETQKPLRLDSVPVRSNSHIVGEAGTGFDDVTSSSQIFFEHVLPRGKFMSLGGGVVILDFNNDGYDDIYLVNSYGANALYANNGNSTFTNVAEEVGLDDPYGWGNGACAADFDNDSDQDIYVTNYGHSRLFINNGEYGFVDITDESGTGDPDSTYRSMGCAWGDYDQDGLLDLVVVRHWHELTSDLIETMQFSEAVRPLVLYHNVGDGRFENVTHILSKDLRFGGKAGNLWGAGFQPTWFDFDDDGDVDLYVTNDFGFAIHPNVLWRNDGAGDNGLWRFTDISDSSGAGVAMFGMGIALGDYDIDGDLDMYVTNIGRNILLRNDLEDLRFTDVSNQSGVEVPNVGVHLRISWSAMFFDYDNDRDEDLFIISGKLEGMGSMLQTEKQPNVLLRNNGDGTFSNVSNFGDPKHLGSGRGGGFLDFDDDGCLDVLVGNVDEGPILLNNKCDTGNHWMKIKLIGNDSNKDAIGASIRVIADGYTQIRQINGGSGFLGQDTRMVHFGMGDSTEIELISIRWPNGKTQELHGISVDQTLVVEEP